MNTEELKTFIFLATLLLVFSGCHNEDDVSGEKQEIKEIVLSEEEKEITEKYTDFAFHLFNQVNLSEKVNNNWIISPYSASLVLSTLANGAEGNTLAEIKSVLGINEFAMNEVNLYYRKLSLALPKLDDIVYLPLLNSIWVNKDVQLHLSFVNACGQYGTEINSLDLRNSNAVNTINDWFVLHTQNRDMRVVDEIPTGHIIILQTEMLPGHFKGLIYALPDRHRRNNDNELCKTTPAIQFKNGFGIDIGFARTSFHFNAELRNFLAGVSHHAKGKRFIGIR